MTFQLCRTDTDKGTRYYVNGKRVTRDAYDEAQFWRVCDSFQTLKIENGYRLFMVARDNPARHP